MLNLHLDDRSFPHGFKFSHFADFCVWVLEIDGLQVAPLCQHPDGNGTLQARGLNANNWKSWLAWVVDLDGNHGLSWKQHGDNKQAWVEEELSYLEEMAFMVNDQIDVPAARAALEREWDLQEQKYQQALARFSQFPGAPAKFAPPDVWIGEPAVGEMLKGLWHSYAKVWEERCREELESEKRIKPGSSEMETLRKLKNDLQPYKTRINGLEIGFVNYPAPVEYLVPPQSVLLSTANGLLDSNCFYESVMRAAESFATLSG